MISAFAIAEQSPGHIEFTMMADGREKPTNLWVVNHQTDENSKVTSTEQKPVQDWKMVNDGWIGRVAFDQDSGIKCFASLEQPKGNKRSNTLGMVSYTSP